MGHAASFEESSSGEEQNSDPEDRVIDLEEYEGKRPGGETDEEIQEEKAKLVKELEASTDQSNTLTNDIQIASP